MPKSDNQGCRPGMRLALASKQAKHAAERQCGQKTDCVNIGRYSTTYKNHVNAFDKTGLPRAECYANEARRNRSVSHTAIEIRRRPLRLRASTFTRHSAQREQPCITHLHEEDSPHLTRMGSSNPIPALD